MDTVLVLIASPSGPPLGASAIDLASALLPGPHERRPLDIRAAEIAFAAPAGLDAASLEARLRHDLADAAIDIAILPAAGRRKKLLLADMDSTMIGQECIDELGTAAGAGERIAEITRQAMRGDLNFESALRERASLLRGLPATVIGDIIRDRITFTSGGRSLVATMRAHGAHTALISGGFTPFTAHVAEQCGFHEHQANRLLEEDGRLTGAVAEPVLGSDAKVAALERLCADLDISPAEAICVGDGANDIAMLRRAGFGVSLHGKPAVREAAGIRIDHGDLTALLYIQGYASSEFAG